MPDRGVTRRGLLLDAAAIGALAATPASARTRPPVRRTQVAVLGGGVGGLTAAHELAERGFEVTVYERRALGGKARSIDVPGTGSGGRRPLPGEHGARFFPGCYRNLPDTMGRIGTLGNLVTATQESYPRSGGREDWNANVALTDPYPWTFEQFRETLIGTLDLATHIPPHEVAYFVDRLLVYFSSCDARRFGEWENRSWWDFVAADRFSEDYRRVLVSGVPRFLLGSKPNEANARTLGLIWEQGLYTLMGREYGAYDRVLDAPTNEALVDPWVAHLSRLGVRFRLGCEVRRLELRGGRVVAAHLRGPRGRETVKADWFVCALPVERARQLWNRDVLAADPRLAGMSALEVRWMNGVQIYLREPVPIVHGHVVYIDSPWALSSISQAQFWNGAFERRYGDGRARDCLSIDIADFDQPGILYRRPARELPPEQIVRDAWAQMKAHLNDTGRATLHDDLILSWFVDPGLVFEHGRPVRNDDPLFISTPGAWAKRPDASTAIPNLFLAADYVRVNIDTATMEGANEAGRRAANALLHTARSREQPAAVFDLYDPPEWDQFRRADEESFRRGLPNAFDAPPPPASLPAVAA